MVIDAQRAKDEGSRGKGKKREKNENAIISLATTLSGINSALQICNYYAVQTVQTTRMSRDKRA